MPEVELRRLRLPLASPFAAAHGTVDHRDVLFVRVGRGWAECVAPVAPTYTAEYAAGAHAVLRDHLVPRWLDGGGDTLDQVRGHPMAKAALGMAALDDRLRREGLSLADHLGAARDRVPAGIALGIAPTVDELVAQVAAAVDEGYQRVKLKVRPGWDAEPAAAVRRDFPDLALSVDANGSYRDPKDLAPLDRLGLLFVEQPMPADDLVGNAEAARLLDTPVCLDESLSSPADVETALALGACEVVCVKPGRVGGIDQAVQIHDLCVERGVPAWVGGMSETGLGRHVLVALAALPGFTLTGDLSASSRWSPEDVITEPFVVEDGHLRVRDAVELAWDVLERHTTSVEVLGRA